ncbi:hypothetical protein B0H19DRAFT_1184132 [Mycena capillaripes]|nr:hypothetical protein B0H19DRAFT_1184132 [Mycena capillaripes]
MAHLDSRLAEYQPEPLHLNGNVLHTPRDPESEGKNMFSPTTPMKFEASEDYVGSNHLDEDNRLHTLPQGLPGRRHPVTAIAQMTGCVLAGAILAAGHHVYFTSLHLTPSDGTVHVGGQAIPHQKITNFVATVFIFLVKLCLSQSIAKAFDQRLWYTVRRSAMKLSGLDALFSVLGDPSAFLNFEMVWRAKLAAGLAFVAWTATFAVIPIPGSLTVQPLETHTTEDRSVSTVNLAKDPIGGAIYTWSPIGAYNTPGPIAQSVANKAIIDDSIATWPSPCGPDCSYNLSFFAPSFKCSAPTSSAIQAVFPIWQLQPTIKGTTTDTLSVLYLSDFQGNIQTQTNCTSFNATYSLSVQYRANQQTVEVLNIAAGASFGTNFTLIIDDPTFRPALAAIKDAVATTLIGQVFQDRETGLSATGNTLVLYSALANDTIPTNFVMRTDTPQLIEQLLTNTTISMIGRNLWSTNASVDIVSNFNVFVYQPHVLWAGYATAIGVTLLSIAVGLHALWRNGGGGGKAFSLIMATTRNPALDAVTTRALQQKDYRVTYGNLRFRYTNLGGRDPDRLAFCQS